MPGYGYVNPTESAQVHPMSYQFWPLKEAPPAGGPVAMACIDIIMQQPASDTDQE